MIVAVAVAVAVVLVMAITVVVRRPRRGRATIVPVAGFGLDPQIAPEREAPPDGLSFRRYVGTERRGPQCPRCGAYDIEPDPRTPAHAAVHCVACDNRWDAPAKGWPDVHLVLWHRTRPTSPRPAEIDEATRGPMK